MAPKPEAAMKRAIENNDLTKVKQLLESGVSPDIVVDSGLGYTALLFAIAKEKKEIIQELVKAGANLDVVDKNGNSAFMHITSYNDLIDLVDEFIKKGVDINRPNKYGITPIYKVFKHGPADVLELILYSGVDLSLRYDRNQKTIGELVQAGAFPELHAEIYRRFTSGAPPRPKPIIHKRVIPRGSLNAITMEPIQDGNRLVNFRRNERTFESNHGQFYKRGTFLQLNKNPFTRRPIQDPTIYNAQIAAEGGRRRRRTVRRKRTRSVKSRK